ncbi:histidine phosphatase family protein [Rhizobium sp. LCM 4573]|uniref:SixA phosphatase family protein n=1 Tax=Rhizobium sp. LCM 4573 TaxID=1848291 RepID=UPI0008DA86A8|nr:histidine phosphatase family protein [Rhizobium sp. LCM 4573]OHV82181.1 hypothetical protein LCM4573_19495 [Rhizobium sp. LCM 4573]
MPGRQKAAHNDPHRRLILLRHAKSAWPENVPDRERPLAARGEKAAPLMGDYMARKELIPDLALVSPARRTRETWALVRDKLPEAVEARECPELYETASPKILRFLQSIEATYRNLLIVGHNPGLQELALLLTGTGDADPRERMIEKYPTAALAVLNFAIASWADIKPAQGHLEHFITPRSLR